MHVWNWYYADQTASDIYIIAGLYLPLAYQAIEWRNDARVREPQLGRGQRGLSAEQIGRTLLFRAIEYRHLCRCMAMNAVLALTSA
jgi:hypothetical protein